MEPEDETGMDMGNPLPKSMQFSDLLERQTPTERTTRSFQPNNGALFPHGQEIRIPLSLPHGSFLDPKTLSFNCAIQAFGASEQGGKVARLDSGISSTFREITVYGPDGSILSRTSNYHMLSQVMNALTTSPEAADSSGISEIEGLNSTVASAPKLDFTTAATSSDVRYYSTPLTYVAALNSDKLLPYGFVSGSAVTVSILLEDAKTSMYTDKAADISYTLSDVSIQADIITFSSTVTNQFEMLLSQLGGVQFHSDQLWQNVSSQAFTAASSLSLQIPVRTRSTNLLLTVLHDQAKLIARDKYSISGKTARSCTEFVHRLAGLNFPPQPVIISKKRQGGAIREIQKALNIYTKKNTVGLGLLIDGAGHDSGTTAARTYYPGSSDIGCEFCIICPLAAEQGAGLENGLDLSSSSSNFEANLKITTPSSTSTLANTWSNADVIYTLTSSGVILASS